MTLRNLTVPALILGVAVLTSGCLTGSQGGTTTRDASDIRDQLFKLQKDSARMLKKVEQLEEKSDDPGSHAACAEAAMRADAMESKLSMLEEQILSTQQRIDETLSEVRAVRQMQGAQIWTGEAAENAPWPGEEPTDGSTTPGTEASYTPPPRPSFQGSPEDLFNAAYADYSRGKYDLALAGFEATQRTDPGGVLADDAQYWLGETMYAMGRYEESAQAFDAVIQNYPQGDKLRPAYLKKGIALFSARRSAEGVRELRHVIDTWPSSDEARIARDYFSRKGILTE